MLAAEIAQLYNLCQVFLASGAQPPPPAVNRDCEAQLFTQFEDHITYVHSACHTISAS